jgi:hypothetical protein
VAFLYLEFLIRGTFGDGGFVPFRSLTNSMSIEIKSVQKGEDDDIRTPL